LISYQFLVFKNEIILHFTIPKKLIFNQNNY